MLFYLGFVRYFMLGKKEFDFLHSAIYVNTRMFFLDKSHSLKCTQKFSIVMSQVGKVCSVTMFICFLFFLFMANVQAYLLPLIQELPQHPT